MLAVIALAKLCLYAGSSEPWLYPDPITAKIWCAGSFDEEANMENGKNLAKYTLEHLQ